MKLVTAEEMEKNEEIKEMISRAIEPLEEQIAKLTDRIAKLERKTDPKELAAAIEKKKRDDAMLG